MLLAHPMSIHRIARRKSALRNIGFAIACVVASMALNVSAFAAAPLPIDPSGLWSTKDDESIIRISPCVTPVPPGAPPAPMPPPGTPITYCGTLVWLKDPLENGQPKTDTSNPDRDKQHRPLIGLELLTELTAEADHWKGKAYNADDGKIYDITFKVLQDKVNGDKGEIRGCVLRILCQSETFTKVQAVPGGDPTLPATPASGHTASPKPATPPHPH